MTGMGIILIGFLTIVGGVEIAHGILAPRPTRLLTGGVILTFATWSTFTVLT